MSGSDTKASLAARVLAGEARAIARAISLIEDEDPSSADLVRQIFAKTGRAYLVGVTGPPGAGKSTLVSALIAELRTTGRAVAVIAVDPSSPITGGALLGDRVRMQAYAGDRDVFIRSMASRGHAGGLAATSATAAAVLDAAGFRTIFLETVGTGQSEVEVAAAADTTVVLEAPEMGDEVQAIKAGLLEVADIVVVNKADRPGAQRTASQLRAMLTAAAPRDVPDDRPRPKRPEVLLATASTGHGVAELLAAIDRRASGTAEIGVTSAATAARLARARAQVWAIVLERLRERLGDDRHAAEASDLFRAVADHQLDPYAAADRLVDRLAREELDAEIGRLPR